MKISLKKFIIAELIFLQLSIHLVYPIQLLANEDEQVIVEDATPVEQSEQPTEQSSQDPPPAEENSQSSSQQTEQNSDDQQANSSESSASEELETSPAASPNPLVEAEDSPPEITISDIKEETTVVASPSPSVLPTPSPSILPTVELVSNDNLATSSNDVYLETGDATASAVAVTTVNTTSINSDLSVQEVNVSKTDNDIVVEQSSVIQSDNDPKSSFTNIEIENSASVSAEVKASTNTGQNCQQVAEGEAVIQTGDALSSATNITMVNSSLIDSAAQFDIINIFDDFWGDLYLTNPYYFEDTFRDAISSCDQDCWDQISVINSIVVNNQVSAVATSGENFQTVASSSAFSNLDIDTGDATATAVAQVDANTTYLNYIYYSLLINNLSGWQGNIYGWEGPESISYADRSQILEYLSARSQMLENRNKIIDRDIEISNQAQVDITTSAVANTGKNIQQIENGSGQIETGDARSVATSYVLANSTLVNSHLQRSYLNILGDWKGNLVFQYPDLEVKFLQSTDRVEKDNRVRYLVEVVNNGLLTARDTVVDQTLSNLVSFIDESLGNVIQTGDNLSWYLGDIAPRQSVQFWVETQLKDNLSENIKSLISSIAVTSRDLESTGNNYARAESYIFYPADEVGVTVINKATATAQSGSDAENQEDPYLLISAKNNVNQFIYPGDSVIFELMLTNDGGDSYQTNLYTLLVDSLGQVIGGGTVTLDTVKKEENIKLTFQMLIPSEAEAGEYKLIAWAEGFNDLDQGFLSDEVSSLFEVKASKEYQYASPTFTSLINASASAQVLGATDSTTELVDSDPEGEKSLLQLILLFPLLVLEMVIRRAKRLL